MAVKVADSRADRLTALLAEQSVDLLLVTDLTNLHYLTGFTGSNGLAVVGKDLRLFVTDFRYQEQIKSEVTGFDTVIAGQGLFKTTVDRLKQLGQQVLGFDGGELTFTQHKQLAGLLPENIELKACDGLVSKLRAVKDQSEIAKIKAAAELANSLYSWICEVGLVGKSEVAVVNELEHRMRTLGASGPSFASIVAAGANGALPHAQPGSEEIPKDTLVVLDFGLVLDHYCSDCTRTFATGELPEQAQEIYSVTKEAQERSLEAVRAGIAGAEVDAIARNIINDNGYGEHFGHGLGHGVGLEVHEAPSLSKASKDTLVTGNVVTVEPGIYLPAKYGVRIEDLVVVEEQGYELLTEFTKELTVVG